MSDNDNRLFLAGLMSGIVAGVLGALLVRQRRAAELAPLPEGGLVLRRRSDAGDEQARLAAADALARARAAADGAQIS